MVHISVFGLLSATCATFVAAQYKEFDQEASLRDSECDNGCFFSSFPGGSCTDDAACMCNQQRYRERYFCCMAEKCLPHVVLESIQRQWSGCEAHGVPIHYPEDFDFKGVCGFELSTTTTTMTSTSTFAVASTAESPAESSAETTRSPAIAQAEAESSRSEPSSTSPQSSSATIEDVSQSSDAGSGVGIMMPGLRAVAFGLGVVVL